MPPELPPGPPPFLRAKFVSRLADRLGRIRTLYANLTDEAREELRQLAHALAGSSGTFGFPRLGDRARTVEELLMVVSDPRRLADAVQDLLREGEEVEHSAPQQG